MLSTNFFNNSHKPRSRKNSVNSNNSNTAPTSKCINPNKLQILLKKMTSSAFSKRKNSEDLIPFPLEFKHTETLNAKNISNENILMNYATAKENRKSSFSAGKLDNSSSKKFQNIIKNGESQMKKKKEQKI